MPYYWVTAQSEYSTDILFKRAADLNELYPRLLSTLCFGREVSIAANSRCLQALADVDDPTDAIATLDRITTRKQVAPKRTAKAFNPVARDESQIFRALLDGQHMIRGFSNPDIRQKLQDSPHLKGITDRRRQSAKVTRIFNRCHAHGLIAKIPHSRRWRLTRHGRIAMSASSVNTWPGAHSPYIRNTSIFMRSRSYRALKSQVRRLPVTSARIQSNGTASSRMTVLAGFDLLCRRQCRGGIDAPATIVIRGRGRRISEHTEGARQKRKETEVIAGSFPGRVWLGFESERTRLCLKSEPGPASNCRRHRAVRSWVQRWFLC